MLAGPRLAGRFVRRCVLPDRCSLSRLAVSGRQPLTFIAPMSYCTRAMRHRYLTGTPATFEGGACPRASQY
jgi:hypothetical protein